MRYFFSQARLAELETPKKMEHLHRLEELKKRLAELEKQVSGIDYFFFFVFIVASQRVGIFFDAGKGLFIFRISCLKRLYYLEARGRRERLSSIVI